MSDHQEHAGQFTWSVDGAVETITLDRPERKNPLTFEGYHALIQAFRSLEGMKDKVKAVVLTGAGGNFCSGGDVHEIIGPLTRSSKPELLRFAQMTGELVKAMRACPQPIVAAIDGVCAGAGAILAMASDLRLGTARSNVAFLFVRVGLGGADMGACSILPRIVGAGRAAELLYTGRALGGDEAFAWGFYNRVCTPESLLDDATACARELADGPTLAHASTKKMLHREWSMGIDDAIDEEAREQALLMGTNDFRRAYEAFAAKRRPKFEGD
jgi:enoyl-CoA hydratase/carnithine racemase